MVAGLAGILVSRRLYHPDITLADYVLALGVGGWVVMLVSAVCLILASLHAHTDFFSLRTRAGGLSVGASVTVIAAVVCAAHVVVLRQLPNTPPDKLPRDPKARTVLVVQERNFKRLVSLSLLTMGGIIAFFPVYRAFRPDGLPPMSERALTRKRNSG